MKILKQQHLIDSEKNQYEIYVKRFKRLQDSKCVNSGLRTKQLKGLRDLIQQDIEQEKTLQHLIKKVSFRNMKESNPMGKNINSSSIGSSRTMASSKQNSVYSEAVFQQNSQHYAFQIMDDRQQKQFLLDFKQEIRDVEQNLIDQKRIRNQLLEEVEEYTDELMDTKNYLKILQKQNEELDLRIQQIQNIINQLSKNGKLTNKSFVNTTILNQTRINTSIVEDVASKVVNIKNFLKNKLSFWNQQQSLQSEERDKDENNPRLPTQNILSEIN